MYCLYPNYLGFFNIIIYLGLLAHHQKILHNKLVDIFKYMTNFLQPSSNFIYVACYTLVRNPTPQNENVMRLIFFLILCLHSLMVYFM